MHSCQPLHSQGWIGECSEAVAGLCDRQGQQWQGQGYLGLQGVRARGTEVEYVLPRMQGRGQRGAAEGDGQIVISIREYDGGHAEAVAEAEPTGSAHAEQHATSGDHATQQSQGGHVTSTSTR